MRKLALIRSLTQLEKKDLAHSSMQVAAPANASNPM